MIQPASRIHQTFNIGLFLLANVLAFFVFLAVLLLLDNTIYRQLVGKAFQGSALELLEGQGKVEGKNLTIQQVGSQGFMIASTGEVDLQSELLSSLEVKFSNLSQRQPLLLMLHAAGASAPLERPIYVDKEGFATFNLQELLADHPLIYDVWVVSPESIIEPFAIERIAFVPKAKSLSTMFALVGQVFSVADTWTGSSINFHGKKPMHALLQPKVLILSYAVLLFVLFWLLLAVFKKPKMQSFWLVLLLAWLVIDARFLTEQVKISGDSYERYRYQTRAQRQAMVVPEIYELAATIKSAIGKPQAEIRVAPTFDANNPQQLGEHSDYFLGRLNYFLAPYALYGYEKKMPLRDWQEGGFYLLVLDNAYYQYHYDHRQQSLGFSNYPSVPAKRLINNKGLQLYWIEKEGEHK